MTTPKKIINLSSITTPDDVLSVAENYMNRLKIIHAIGKDAQEGSQRQKRCIMLMLRVNMIVMKLAGWIKANAPERIDEFNRLHPHFEKFNNVAQNQQIKLDDDRVMNATFKILNNKKQ